MKIELLWWRGCPSWERTLEILRQEVEALGLDPGSIDVREALAGAFDRPGM